MLSLCLALALAAPSVARAEDTATATTAVKKKKRRLPRVIARALGIVTSTVAQTEAQQPGRTPRNYFSLLPEPLLVAELEARHAAPGPYSARVERVTRGMLGAPYLLGALGEGEREPDVDRARFDPDPRFRLDAFDCTTFVETALAMSLADHPDAAARLLDRIRYEEGKVAFDWRRHLMTSQWIPGLVAEGWFEDITKKIGGAQTRTIHLDLSEARWKMRHIAKALVLPESRVPRGTFDLDYLPTKAALELSEKIPPGTVINVVRADWVKSPDVITHQGIVVLQPGGKERYVRHASPLAKRVVDEPLARMLGRYLNKPGNWKVVGVNLLKMSEQAPQASLASSAASAARTSSTRMSEVDSTEPPAAAK